VFEKKGVYMYLYKKFVMKSLLILLIGTSVSMADMLDYYMMGILPGLAASALVSVGVKKTGQTKSYDENGTVKIDGSIKDDGFYQSGVTPSYKRVSNTVTDNVTHLIWQDDTTPATMAWNTAQTYCSNLSLDSYTDWRLPTRKELVGLSDYGRYDPAIDPTFQNTVSNYYWSSITIAGYSSYAWVVYFDSGYQTSNTKTNNGYVRCVRAGE